MHVALKSFHFHIIVPYRTYFLILIDCGPAKLVVFELLSFVNMFGHSALQFEVPISLTMCLVLLVSRFVAVLKNLKKYSVFTVPN